MKSASKYSFDNVLVSDTQLNVNLSHHSSDQSTPEVIILNSKINRCPLQEPATSNCNSCCLESGRPEFRKRSNAGLSHIREECLAICGQRRAVNIQLFAQSQLSGKLVILALTRVNLPSNTNNTIKPTSQDFLRCQTDKTWSFARFDNQPPVASTSGKQLTFYSAIKQHTNHNNVNQHAEPKINIKSLEIYWDAAKQKELVSIYIQPSQNMRNTINQETLLVAEFDCHLSPLISPQESTYLSGKVHLLAILNRESDPPRYSNNSTPPPPVAIDTNKQQIRRTIVSSPATTPSQEVDLMPDTNISEDNTIMNRIDRNNNRFVGPEVRGTPSDKSSVGLIQSMDLSNLKSSMRSHSFLVLTVTSSLVILVYSLCLLIYLKTKNRAGRSNVPKTELRPKQSDILMPQKSQPEHKMNISTPFNLQMPEATRIRLEMMLNMNGKRRKSRPRNDSAVASRPKRAFDGSGSSLSFVQTNSRLNEDDLLCLDPIYAMQMQATNNQQQAASFSYQTVNVMRAIRQAAATLARSKLRPKRYQSNLNVIHESDMEYLQSTPQTRRDILATIIDKMPQDHRNAASQLSIDQVDALVHDAMSRNCSHLARKAELGNNMTLFSTPSVSRDANDTFSRSQIIEQTTSAKENDAKDVA